MKNIGIFFGSSTGNTESAARQIQKELGEDVAQVFDVAKAKPEDLNQFSNLILGASTWGVGDLQDDFDDFFAGFNNVEFKGKKVAIFGLGDQMTYADSFVDGIGSIYDELADKGCEFVGKVSTDGYDHDESAAIRDNAFIGLPLDEDNQSNLTNERIENWVAQLKKEFN